MSTVAPKPGNHVTLPLPYRADRPREPSSLVYAPLPLPFRPVAANRCVAVILRPTSPASISRRTTAQRRVASEPGIRRRRTRSSIRAAKSCPPSPLYTRPRAMNDNKGFATANSSKIRSIVHRFIVHSLGGATRGRVLCVRVIRLRSPHGRCLI